MRRDQQHSPQDFQHGAAHLRCNMDYVLRCDSAKVTLPIRHHRSRCNSPARVPRCNSPSPARVPSLVQSTVCSESESVFRSASPRDLDLADEVANASNPTSPASSFSRAGTVFESMTLEQGRLRGRGLTYEGQLFNGMEHGKGVLSWDDGREYQGHFLTGRFHGAGIMKWPDGRRYEGEYQNDRKHGAGTFLWPEGVFYCGQWSDGKKHGTGSFTDNTGVTRRYRWMHDKPVMEDSPRHDKSVMEDSSRQLEHSSQSVPQVVKVA